MSVSEAFWEGEVPKPTDTYHLCITEKHDPTHTFERVRNVHGMGVRVPESVRNFLVAPFARVRAEKIWVCVSVDTGTDTILGLLVRHYQTLGTPVSGTSRHYLTLGTPVSDRIVVPTRPH